MVDFNNIETINLGLDSITVAKTVVCDIENILSYVTKNNLNIILQNIRSINCNINNFITLILRSKIDWDVMVLTECWLPSSKFIPEIDGFNFISTLVNRTQNEGVVIYFNKYLDVSFEEPQTSDANCLLLKLSSETCILGIYRSPSKVDTTNFTNSIDLLLSKLNSYRNVILCGDININIAEDTEDRRSNDYLNVLASHGLLPGHVLPTRGPTCLDHMMLRTRLDATCFIVQSSITDHECVALSIVQHTKLNYLNKPTTRIDYDALDIAILNIDFKLIHNCSDVDMATDLLINLLVSAIKDNSKLVEIPKRKIIHKPWITKGLLRCMRNRDNLHKKIKKDPENEVLKTTFRRYRNFCNALLKKAKRNFEKKEIENVRDNKKKLWEVIRNISGQKRPIDHSSSLLIPGKQDMCINEVNHYFSEIGRKLAEDQVNTDQNSEPCSEPDSHIHSLVLLPTDELEVFNLIMGLKSKCAVGQDQISGHLIKRYAHLLSSPITHICNLSFSHGNFPNAFKVALIKPIYKGGERDRVENFRPISILPTLSKILERLMNKRLTFYLESNNLLSPSQFGFRSQKSTNDAVQELTNAVITNLDKRRKCLVVFLDLAKAFDTVSIPILLRKLETSGIRGLPLKLFSDYLTGRKQRVKIGHLISNEQPVSYGVPQGSILGPSLFLIYINSLCNMKLENGRIITFADDTALLFEGNSWVDTFKNAQNGVTRVCTWLKSNVLTLNTAKTNYIAFALRSNLLPPASLSITAHNCSSSTASCTCNALQRTDNTKYLGIYIDQTLTFKRHIGTLVARTRKLIYVFRELKHVADRNTIKTVYMALCESIIGYCITSWGGAAKTHLIEIERAQRAVLKVGAGFRFQFPTTQLFREWDVLSVRQYFLLQIILYKHSHLTYDRLLVKDKRRKGSVCPALNFRTSLSHNFVCFLGPYIYNKANTMLSIYPLPRAKCKAVVVNWLKTLTYQETENLLSTQS